VDSDNTVDRVAEVLSQDSINMTALAVIDPDGYVACREITATLWPVLTSVCAKVTAMLAAMDGGDGLTHA
jgi:hypothetical protein